MELPGCNTFRIPRCDVFFTVRFTRSIGILRYPRLPYDVFTDTLIAGTVSKRGNKYSQAFGTSFGWTRSYPMATKGQAHEALSLLFKRDGVPPTMISDGSKEQAIKK